MSRFQKPFVSFSARFAANVLRAIQKDGAARLVSALVQQSTVVFLDPHSHLRHLAPTEAYVWFSAYDLIDRERVWQIKKNSQTAKDYYISSLYDKSEISN